MYEKYKKCKDVYEIEKNRFNVYLKEYDLVKKIIERFLFYLKDNMDRVLYYINNSVKERQAYHFSLQYTKLEKYYKVFLKYRRKFLFYRGLKYMYKTLTKIDEIRAEYYTYNRLSQMDYMYEKRDEINIFLYNIHPLIISIQKTIDTDNTQDMIIENEL